MQSFILKIRPAWLPSLVKKLLLIRRNLVTTPEGSFYIDKTTDFGSRLIGPNGYEPLFVGLLKSELNSGDTFLDLGGNEGYFTVIASKQVGQGGRVVCIEPQSRLQPLINRNLKENEASNVDVHQVVISDDDGFAELHLTPDVNSGGSGLFRNTKYRLPVEFVPQLTMASFFARTNLGQVDLLKIDIEGFEYEAIFGSKDLFRSGTIKRIALELHSSLISKRGKDPDSIVKFLEECGYRKEEHPSGFLIFHNESPDQSNLNY